MVARRPYSAASACSASRLSPSISSTRSKAAMALLLVAEAVAPEHAHLEGARRALRGILGEEEHALGDLDDARPVCLASRRARAGARAPSSDRGSSSATTCSSACAASSRLCSRSSRICARRSASSTARAGSFGERHLLLEDAHERRPVALARVDARQRLERLGVARQDLAELLPALAGAADVAQRVPRRGAPARACTRPAPPRRRRCARPAGRARARGPRACRAPRRGPRAPRAPCVVGIEAHDLLPALGGARRILQRPLVQLRDARDELDLLVVAAGVLDVLIEDAASLRASPARSRTPSRRVSVSRSPGTACRISFAAHSPCARSLRRSS